MRFKGGTHVRQRGLDIMRDRTLPVVTAPCIRCAKANRTKPNILVCRFASNTADEEDRCGYCISEGKTCIKAHASWDQFFLTGIQTTALELEEQEVAGNGESAVAKSTRARLVRRAREFTRVHGIHARRTGFRGAKGQQLAEFLEWNAERGEFTAQNSGVDIQSTVSSPIERFSFDSTTFDKPTFIPPAVFPVISQRDLTASQLNPSNTLDKRTFPSTGSVISIDDFSGDELPPSKLRRLNPTGPKAFDDLRPDLSRLDPVPSPFDNRPSDQQPLVLTTHLEGIVQKLGESLGKRIDDLELSVNKRIDSLELSLKKSVDKNLEQGAKDNVVLNENILDLSKIVRQRP